MNTFFQLIRIALGIEDSLEETLDERQWAEIYKIAAKQSMIGVVYQGIIRLPAHQLPPLGVKIKFALMNENIENRNAELDSAAKSISTTFKEMGFRSCLLKGQGIALYYPWPHSRQCGDIDIWLDKDRDTILENIRTRWKTSQVCYHHTDIKPFNNDLDIKSINNDLEVEVHFTPSWMNDPLANWKLQRYFRKNAGAQFDNFLMDKGFSRPLNSFDCVFILVHIYRHLLQEGIGLRQIMDYYFVLMHSSSEDRNEAYGVVSALGMKRFTSSLMYVLSVIFNIPDGKMLCAPDARNGEVLLNEIMLAGNFGKFDPRNAHGKETELRRFLRRLFRVFRYMKFAPREVLWAPAFRIWQYFWGKSKK